LAMNLTVWTQKRLRPINYLALNYLALNYLALNYLALVRAGRFAACLFLPFTGLGDILLYPADYPR